MVFWGGRDQARAMRLGALLLFVAACEDRAAPAPVSEPPPAATTASASAAAPQPSARPRAGASASAVPAASAPPVDGRCLSREDIAADLPLQWKMDNELSVVRVAPDDALKVRKDPGTNAAVVASLAYDGRGIRATGKACTVGKTMWLSIRSGTVEGWASARFLMPTSTPEDQTAAYRRHLGGADHPSPESLVAALVRKLEAENGDDAGPPFKVETVGVSRRDETADAVLHACCYADDSVSGEQVFLELAFSGGRWRLEAARVSHLCPRGADGTRCR
jgi:hypothetical protein